MGRIVINCTNDADKALIDFLLTLRSIGESKIATTVSVEGIPFEFGDGNRRIHDIVIDDKSVSEWLRDYHEDGLGKGEY